MGKIGCFTSVSEEILASLKADEDSIEEFLYPDDGESEPENYITWTKPGTVFTIC